jgi:hypothetical protein
MTPAQPQAGIFVNIASCGVKHATGIFMDGEITA